MVKMFWFVCGGFGCFKGLILSYESTFVVCTSRILSNSYSRSRRLSLFFRELEDHSVKLLQNV